LPSRSKLRLGAKALTETFDPPPESALKNPPKESTFYIPLKKFDPGPGGAPVYKELRLKMRFLKKKI